MSIEIKVPNLPESVSEATVSTWYKKAGDAVKRDENLVDLETDKVVLEVPAPADGVLKEVRFATGATVGAGDVVGIVEEGATASAPAAAPAVAAATPRPAAATPKPAAVPAPAAAEAGADEEADGQGPAIRKLLKEMGVSAADVKGTGKGGRLTREDVLAFANNQTAGKPTAPAAQAPAAIVVPAGPREEQRVPMTRIRQRIAERLVEAQATAAMLTTFNEVDLKAVSDLRARYKESFEKTHGVKLGFMSFFVRAAVEALKKFPAVNASIDGTDVIYHGYYDVGIAVSTERGLVVPVLRDADTLSFADIEKGIAALGVKARANKLTMADLTGGTFSITNGGVFGSLMSTPILNPPQGAILGMHGINPRPVVVDGEIVVRPMMYLALTYDHRLIDGRESVLFLRTIKELLEDPARLLLQL
ncbi:MAG: 2-oxoglutarate dehydrogenase complex dihydrolipoyllysine-residue succinyltransferase [Nevskiaceae bacterium]|nr:MAG: 2-oxoglutarate dehydrogenase complex dihydrolipoyllysine-residue succinyltransferase [Nevskiaceae bacterium]TBR73904.1 MAG: 2-oxoglutarate dehydrogenase complex dihydrolipoyllysine-residue succinyltransferase [Nevskiaceae bacterium]